MNTNQTEVEEFQKEGLILNTCRFIIVDVTGDGNCLFHSLVDISMLTLYDHKYWENIYATLVGLPPLAGLDSTIIKYAGDNETFKIYYKKM